MWIVIIFGIILGLLFLLFLRDKIKRNSKGRYILVTGCDTGLGNALAKTLDQLGCHVLATCLTTEGEQELKNACSERLQAITMDVSRNRSIKAAFDTVKDILVDKSEGLWGLVNIAGVPPNPGYYDWWTREEFRRVLEINLLGPVDVTNVFLPLLKRAKGRIVNVSNATTMLPLSSGGYDMATCGLEAYSDCLRQQMRYFSVSVHLVSSRCFCTHLNDETVVANSLEMAWNQMSQRKRDEYGIRCIDQIKQIVNQRSKAFNQRLDLATDAIEHALFAWFPWKRYPVFAWFSLKRYPGAGFPIFLAHTLKNVPASFSDFVRNKRFPLPKPQACA